LVLASGDDGEPVEVGLLVWEICTGVGRRWRVILDGGDPSGFFLALLAFFRDVCSGVGTSFAKMQRRLWVRRMVGEWIELEFPPMMVGGELWSKVVGAWGAAPVDGLSAMPLSRPFG